MRFWIRLSVVFNLLVFVAAARGAEDVVDFDVLRYRAKMLAMQPYAARSQAVPESLAKLTYDQYRLITFNPARTWWRRE